MEIHVLHARDGLKNWSRSGGFFWFCVNRKNQIVKWKGPFVSKSEIMWSLQAVSPSVKIVWWDETDEVPAFAIADLRVDYHLQH
jgi:hypothetical protein